MRSVSPAESHSEWSEEKKQLVERIKVIEAQNLKKEGMVNFIKK